MGYCEGVTFDWIRRALLPKVKEDGSASPKIVFVGNKPDRDLRHAKAQIDFETKQVEHQDSWEDEVLKQHHSLNWYRELDQEFAGYADPIERSDLSRTEKDRKLERQAETRAGGPERSRNKEPYSPKPSRDGVTGRLFQKTWWAYAKALDKVIEEQRKTAAKRAVPVVDSAVSMSSRVKSKIYSGGIGEFVTNVLKDPYFRTNCAAQMVISRRSGASGYAIAIFRLNTSVYILFDPNVCTYAFTLPSALRSAIVYLFTIAYPNMEGGGDAHVYEVDGQIKGRF